MAGFSDDYDGNTRTAPWDIGADQTGGSALATPPAAGVIGTGGGGTAGTPIAPTGLNGTGSVNLTWQDNSNNETGFRVERRMVGGSYAAVTTTAANVTSYADTPGPGNWNYRVFAVNATGDSLPSNEITVNVPVIDPGTGGSKSGGGGGCYVAPSAAAPWLLLVLLAATPCRRFAAASSFP